MELVTVENMNGHTMAMPGGHEDVLTIREVAGELGLTQRAIRFYEEKKLVSPQRNGSTRLYRRKDRARLQLIKRGSEIGLSLGEIREILDLYDPARGCREQYQRALQLFERRIAVLRERREELERQEEKLLSSCERFSSYISAAE
ncbi:MAG: MerR family transcriptional regulator [Parvibaculaceae bacterium]|nr:MerR family transcriptional regulator [Parvibaculaceae bacterium]